MSAARLEVIEGYDFGSDPATSAPSASAGSGSSSTGSAASARSFSERLQRAQARLMAVLGPLPGSEPGTDQRSEGRGSGSGSGSSSGDEEDGRRDTDLVAPRRVSGGSGRDGCAEGTSGGCSCGSAGSGAPCDAVPCGPHCDLSGSAASSGPLFRARGSLTVSSSAATTLPACGAPRQHQNPQSMESVQTESGPATPSGAMVAAQISLRQCSHSGSCGKGSACSGGGGCHGAAEGDDAAAKADAALPARPVVGQLRSPFAN
jgi:hypothetical protein